MDRFLDMINHQVPDSQESQDSSQEGSQEVQLICGGDASILHVKPVPKSK